MKRSITIIAAAGVLAGAGVHAQGAVHVVDDDGGSDFLAIQAAVDAAAEGDLVLVREGTYASFTISGKSVVVVADDEADVTITNGPTEVATITVSNLVIGQRALLQGLDVDPVLIPSGPGIVGGTPGIIVEDCQGSVWIEDCNSRGNIQTFGKLPAIATTAPGAHVTNSPAVTFVRCFLEGSGPLDLSIYEVGGHGLVAVDSSVSLYQCELLGGPGEGGVANLVGLDCTTPQEASGDGAHVERGFLFASGCTFEGGSGLPGLDGIEFLTTVGGNGGSGGTGLRVLDPATDVQLQKTTLRAGLGGPPGLSFGGTPVCANGPDGLVLEGPPETVTPLPGEPLTVVAPSPLREGVPASFELVAEPGDLLFLGMGFEPESIWVPNLVGVIQYGFPGFWFAVGLAPGDGELSLPFVILELGPGVESVLLYWQTFVLRGASEFFLGGASTMVLLDQAIP